MKNKQKVFVRIICILLAVLMALSVVLMVIPAEAVSEADVERLQVKRQALEEQMQKQTELIESLTNNHELIIHRKAALDQLIELNRSEVELLEEQLGICNEMVEEKAQELEAAKEAEQEQHELLRVRVRSMEENYRYSYLSFIFEAKSISELLSRITDIADIMEHDQSLEKSLREAREALEAVTTEYTAALKEQSDVSAELDAKKAQLDAQIEAACQLIAQLDTLTTDAEAEYAAIEKAEADAMEEIMKAAAELAAQRAAAAATGGSGYSGGGGSGYYTYTGSGYSGGFIWPTDSKLVTSNYGYRDQPTAGASTYHQAIDIGAAAGSPIYAAADGQIVTATSNDGLGNYVSIDHGEGTVTRYSHMTNYIVQPGQYVTQGQIIGYVGSSGIATGPHLDYAVIENGQAVDPLSKY